MAKTFSAMETKKTISHRPSFRKLLLNVFQQNKDMNQKRGEGLEFGNRRFESRER